MTMGTRFMTTGMRLMTAATRFAPAPDHRDPASVPPSGPGVDDVDAPTSFGPVSACDAEPGAEREEASAKPADEGAPPSSRTNRRVPAAVPRSQRRIVPRAQRMQHALVTHLQLPRQRAEAERRRERLAVVGGPPEEACEGAA